MSWLLNTAEKATIDAFDQFIESVVKANEGRNIYIWGASVRGTLLGILLEQNGFSDFLYVDNDERKWGTNINGHCIISANDFLKIRNNGYVIVPVEHYTEIREQLLSWSMIENFDFYILKSELYADFFHEFFRKYNGKYLVFGETFLRSVLLDEKPMRSMQDDLYEAFGKENMKILSIVCMGMEESYYYLKKQISLNMRPENLLIFVNFETLTEKHHMLPRVQHPVLTEMIQSGSEGVSPDLSEYIKKAKERALDYRLELQYSPRRTYSGEPDDVEIQKEYTRQQLLNQISSDYEECQYLVKILQTCMENKIEAAVIVVPVNYQKASDFFGERYKIIHKKNIETLSRMILDLNCEFIDMSELLEKDLFETRVTLMDGIRYEGRKRITQKLKTYFGLQE